MIEEEPHRRLPRPGWGSIATGAIVGGIGVAAMIMLHEPASPRSHFIVTTKTKSARTQTRTDPLMAELLRCRSLPAGKDDAACREVWEISRRHFTGESRSYIAPIADNAVGQR